MLWSLLLFPTLSLAFNWLSFLGGTTASDQYIIQTPELEPRPDLRVAIVGAGAAGSSAAFWLHQAATRLGKNISVDVYERSGYIGGRSTTVYPYEDDTLPPVELGGSTFVDANKNMVRAAQEFGLEVKSLLHEDDQLGIWDGSQFLITTGATSFFGKIWENIKMLWRYGYRSPTTTSALVKQMIDVYLSLYKSVTHWESIEELSSSLNFTEIVAQTAASYLSDQGVGDAFVYEVIEASTRVNYGQNVDKIHGLEGLYSMTANGAKQVNGGNYQIFRNFLYRSRALLHLKNEVLGIEQKADKAWTLTIKSSQTTEKYSPITKEFDAVILAAPFDTLGIRLPSSIKSVTPTPYVHLHVTLLTTKSRSPNPSYFGLDQKSDVPSVILTTAQGIRAGGPAPEFKSLSYHGPVAEGKDEWVVEIFSEEEIKDEWLHKVFSHVGWVHRKVWDSYPILLPTTSYNPMTLDKGLYYVNGFETFISTMETETIASRGIVDLLLKDVFGESICPSGYSSQPPEGSDFVWGFDC